MWLGGLGGVDSSQQVRVILRSLDLWCLDQLLARGGKGKFEGAVDLNWGISVGCRSGLIPLQMFATSPLLGKTLQDKENNTGRSFLLTLYRSTVHCREIQVFYLRFCPGEDWRTGIEEWRLQM